MLGGFRGHRRGLFLLCAVAAAGVLLAGASPVAHGGAAPPAPAGSVTIVEPTLPDTLDPYLSHSAAGADVADAVFQSLIAITPHGSPRPRLALRWGRSPDSLRWTVWLDPAARWSDGVPVTARDVLFTAGLVAQPAFGAVSTLGFDHVKTITAVGDHQVTVVLTGPYAPFMATFGTAPILPAHVLQGMAPGAVAGYAPFSNRPIGSGPFVVSEFVPGDHVTLVANPLYAGGPVGLAQVVLRSVPGRAAALDLLRAGAGRGQDAVVLPPALGLSASEFLALRAAGASAGVAAYATPGSSWLHIDLVESGALRQTAVRQALAQATPKAAIVRQVLQGLGTVAGADQPPWTRWYEPSVTATLPFDPAAAHRELLHLGFRPRPDGVLVSAGEPLSITLWAPRELAGAAGMVALVARAWQGIGVQVVQRVVPAATVFASDGPLLSPRRFRAPTLNAVLYAWTNAPDPDDSAYWESGQVAEPNNPAGANFVGYRSATADRLIAAGLAEIDLHRRTSIYQRLQLQLAHDQPAIFLAWPDLLSATSARLTGYEPNALLAPITWNVADWRLQPRG